MIDSPLVPEPFFAENTKTVEEGGREGRMEDGEKQERPRVGGGGTDENNGTLRK